MFYQVASQILLLLYATSATATTGGLETVFKQSTFMGIPMDPIVVLGLSIAITFKSCISIHLKVIKTEKVFVPFTSKIFIVIWGFFASARRILSIVIFFVPSLGLLNVLYHIKAEQFPFTIWKEYDKTQADKIALYGLQRSVVWGDIDRWDYSQDPNGTPPHYSEYTGLSLKEMFYIFYILLGVQFLTTLVAKMYTSIKFFEKRNFFNKFIHLLMSLNVAIPFEDWDEGRFTVAEYKERQKRTNTEMIFSMAINIIFSVVMLIPVWYTGRQLIYIL